jgi:hypothetical protein
MKKTTGLAALLILFVLHAPAQVIKNPKPFLEPELTLIDVVRNVNSHMEVGEQTIKRCCGGLRLVAVVEKGKGPDAGKNVISSWHVYDENNKELKGELVDVEPTGQEKPATETVVVIKQFGYGFIVARRSRP